MTTSPLDGKRVGADPPAPFDVIRDLTNRAVRGPGSSAGIRQVKGKVELQLEPLRAELVRLQGEAGSRQIRLATDVVRERHAERMRAVERQLAALEGFVAELEREIPKRVEAEHAYEALLAATNPVTKKINWDFARDYNLAAGGLAAVLLKPSEHAPRVEELRRLARELGKNGDDIHSLTTPLAPGTPELAPLWVDEAVRLPTLWNRPGLMFWPPTHGIVGSTLFEPPAARREQRNPAAARVQATRESHLNLDQPFVHHGTQEDDNRQRERLTEHARQHEQRHRSSQSVQEE